MTKWVLAGTNKVTIMFQQHISVAILELLNLQQDLSVTSIGPDCAWITGFDLMRTVCYLRGDRKLLFSTYSELRVQRSHRGDTGGIYGWWMRTIVMLMQSDASDDPQSRIIYELAPRWIHTSSSGDTKKSEDYQTPSEKSALKERSYQRRYSAG